MSHANQASQPDYASMISRELGIRANQAEKTIQLLEAGNTVPFIARYRKEATGELDENAIRDVEEKLSYLKNLLARKEEVLRLIGDQGKLTPELSEAIARSGKLVELDDIYRPYRQKRRTKGYMARERGLEPLANLIYGQQLESGSLEELASPYVNPDAGVPSWEAALEGAQNILAEELSDDLRARNIVRQMVWDEAALVSKGDKAKVAGTEFQDYAEHSEPVRRIPPHRILAMNRGEAQELLKVKVEIDPEKCLSRLRRLAVLNSRSIFVELLEEMVQDAYKRLIFPAVERELRTELTEKAGEHAIRIFGTNLKALLLQPPIKGYCVMGIDPGFRTGCKVAAVDATGKVLETAVIYPHPPQNRVEDAMGVLRRIVSTHAVGLISIGNGTASRETEAVVVEVIRDFAKYAVKIQYIMTSEAGASVYSASKLAGAELPDMDVSMRGAVSIARRCQDPLAELVKIEPKAVGVGLYQHDVDQKRLQESLEGVVESCVSYVGVDLNTASPALLQHVAGIQATVAKNVVAYREKNGPFRRRQDLALVPRLGGQTFVQCAGFLRIPDGDDVLDNTSVHPESYAVATEILKILGYTPGDLLDRTRFHIVSAELGDLDPKEIAAEMGVGIPTVRDIIDALRKPGRDPRESLPRPLLRTDVLSMEDLQTNMVLKGTVRNVVDFGAFVDIGVKQDGMVHISELSDTFIKHPTDFVAVGDIVTVKVIAVDRARKRISLSMKLTSDEVMVH